MGMTLEELKADETTINIGGIDIMISEEARPLAEMSTIDYEDWPDGGVFTIGLEEFPDF